MSNTNDTKGASSSRRPRLTISGVSSHSRINQTNILATRNIAEELERTEQSITRTLQEIDKQFSLANRIISEHIIPSIYRYHMESSRVWSGGEFWKEFFESSADVALSAYEEDIDFESITDTDRQLREDDMVQRRPTASDSTSLIYDDNQKSRLRVTSTPAGKRITRRDSSSQTPRTSLAPSGLDPFVTPNGLSGTGKDVCMLSSPFMKSPVKSARKSGVKYPDDKVSHQVLNKTWKVQATPKSLKPSSSGRHTAWFDTSSPEIEVPKFQTSILNNSPRESTTVLSQRNANTLITPKGKKNLGLSSLKNAFTPGDNTNVSEDNQMAISPPSTTQFDGVARLMRTPAKEAADAIVSDILKSIEGFGEGSGQLSETPL